MPVGDYQPFPKPPDRRLQLTAFGARDRAFLEVGFGPTAFPIYGGAG